MVLPELSLMASGADTSLGAAELANEGHVASPKAPFPCEHNDILHRIDGLGADLAGAGHGPGDVADGNLDGTWRDQVLSGQ